MPWKTFVLLLILWLVLTAGGGAFDIAAGLFAAAAGAIARQRTARRKAWRLSPLRLALQLPHFFYRSLAGGIDVARRVFHPRLPLNPGWIRYRLLLPTGTPYVLLGGELSLQPGTLAAGSDRGELLIHCLDTNLPVMRIVVDEEERLQRAIEK